MQKNKEFVKFENVDKSYDGKQLVVKGLNLDIEEGEFVTMLGPSGSGKTTCLRTIATLIKPDEGDVFVGGSSVVNESFKVRGKIGFLTSELKLEDHFTPNYLYTYFSKLHNVDEEIIEERKEKLFKRFGINDFKEVKVADLSTGMKQKTSIAISLVHDPEFVIFDEPTNGLDVLTARSVTDYLIELKEQGKTVILSTHILSVVEKLCDRVGIIINGKMKVCDTTENVKNSHPSKDLEEVFFTLIKEEGGEFQ
jgi:ABC-type multidrug transport system ATPase subunit